MAGFIKAEVEKLPIQPINTKINSEIFEKFQKKCKQQNIPMYIVIETFCRQYANGKYCFKRDDVLKWKDKNDKTSVLNTPINKNVYLRFKDKVKDNGYFIRHILSAFIDDYGQKNLVLEFVDRTESDDEAELNNDGNEVE